MSHQVHQAGPLLTMAQLVAAGRTLRAPFACRLRHHGGGAGRAVTVHCVEVLRLLPGRRVVARVEVGGRVALLKLFLGRGAGRYCRREAAGVERLLRAGVPTPARLATLTASNRGDVAAHALLFEHRASAAPAPTDTATLCAVAGWLARLHATGCRHRDLHFGNVLADADGQLLLVDGDGVRRARPWGALGRGAALANLAMLCAQRSPLADDDLDRVYAAYAAARVWPVDARSLAGGTRALGRATARQRRRRLRRYLRKSLRDCSEFRVEHSWRRFVVALRAEWNAVAAFADDPEAVLAGARVLKAGNSATVVRAHIGGRPRIVKRYNLKSPWHALRRALHPAPRYRVAWRNGQGLTLLGIPTARPLLLLERRCGPLRGVAYLVMEDLGDRDLAAASVAGDVDGRCLDEVVGVFRALAAAGLSHGDTKASNLLLAPAGVSIIDLDAMGESATGRVRDLRRFLANFDGQPALRARFERALRDAGLLAP